MKRIAIFVSALALMLAANVASAQATRTWVSGVGSDLNPCSLTAPCKTWAGAYVNTAIGGEIDALDSGGYGSLTIAKALTIDGGTGNIASSLTGATNGFTISAAATDRVIIRNVEVNGTGGGIAGIKINTAKSVTISNVTIFNLSGGVMRGIDAQCTAACRVTVRDSRIDNNSGIGIVLQGTVANVVTADISNTSVSNNGSHGIFATNGAKVMLSNVVASENGISGLIADGTGTTVSAYQSTFANNVGSGVQAGTGAAVTTTIGLTKSSVTGNSPGVQISGGTVQTHNDNAILRNNVDVAGGVLAGVSQQ
ncbi:MAG: hypothetical protein JWO56_54 [Acidobacteria bacterium]|nr:hypothetical protein [Acidobacteriota bacterium]